MALHHSITTRAGDMAIVFLLTSAARRVRVLSVSQNYIPSFRSSS